MCRYDCYRSHVIYRCTQTSKVSSYLLRFLFPPKKDLEIGGEIGEGLIVYHGHGTVVAAHSRIGKNFAVYQGVTIGRNTTPGRTLQNPIIGDNVKIGAGAVVMKDVSPNSVVIGNPCVIKPMA